MNQNEFIIKRFKELREEFNLSPDELGKKMSKNGSYINAIELGLKNVGILHVLKLCEVLNIEPNKFYEGYVEE